METFAFGHWDIIRKGSAPGETKVVFLNRKGIKIIQENSKQVTIRELEIHRFGRVPAGMHPKDELNDTVSEYNPRQLPPLKFNPTTNQWELDKPYFSPLFITVNDEQYAVDSDALPQDCFDSDSDNAREVGTGTRGTEKAIRRNYQR